MFKWKVENCSDRSLEGTLQTLSDDGFDIQTIVPPRPESRLWSIVACRLADTQQERIDEDTTND